MSRERSGLKCLVLLVLLTAVGCGSRSLLDTNQNQEEEQEEEQPDVATGHYELRFDRYVDASTGETSDELPDGDRAALAFDPQAPQRRAILTPYAGEPNDFAVERRQQTLVLDGKLRGITLRTFRGYEYDHVELPLDERGLPDLGGRVVARGRAYNASGQSNLPATLEGGRDFEATGTLEADELTPGLSMYGPLRRKALQLLPWDPVTVAVTEPVDADSLRQGARIEVGGRGVEAVSSDSPSDRERNWAGVVASSWRADDFSALAEAARQAGVGSLPALFSVTGAGVEDASGHPVKAPQSLSYEVLSVGPASSRYTFQTAQEGVALWNVTGSFEAPWPLCALAGCIGFYVNTGDPNQCTEQGMGVLLSLPAGAQSFRVSYQVFAGSPPPKDFVVLSIESVARGHEPTLFEVAVPPLVLTPNGVFESGLNTVAVPVPEGALEVGVSIVAGPLVRCTKDWTQALSSITIDEITSE